MNSFSNLNQN